MQRPVKRVQVALIHVAVSITIFPVESTLNRVMINELAISALLVGALLALPYLFSPVQVAIGAFADRNPIFGLRRTPYIVIGLTLCLAGCLLAPYAAFSLAEGGTLNILLAVLMFGLWGTGFNFATVSYFSIASELWDEQGRSTTIALMFLLMIASFIAMASVIGRIVDPYTTEALFRAFRVTAAIAFVLGILGVIGLEPRRDQIVVREPVNILDTYRALFNNRVARQFFIYLLILLVALLGNDIFIEPYGAAAFDSSVSETTLYSRVYNMLLLAGLVLGAAAQRRWQKEQVVRASAWFAVVGFVLLILGGVIVMEPVFYGGLLLLGFGAGASTVSNLSLMLDMIVAGNVGLFIGAWGSASGFARAVGNMGGGALLEGLSRPESAASGYFLVFGSFILCLLGSLWLLRRIDVDAFRRAAQETTITDQVALVGESAG